MDIKQSPHKELGDIFEKIEEFDNVFGTISPTLQSPIQLKESAGHERMADTNDAPLVPMNRNSFGMNRSNVVV